jgi:hypothetical protein
VVESRRVASPPFMLVEWSVRSIEVFRLALCSIVGAVGPGTVKLRSDQAV